MSGGERNGAMRCGQKQCVEPVRQVILRPLVVPAAGLSRPTVLAGWLLVPALWEASGAIGLFPEIYLPTPSAILAALYQLLITGELLPALGASFVRWIGGSAIGATAALAFAFTAGLSATFRSALLPLVYFLYPVPKIAILPLLILWLGIGETPKWLLIGLGVFFPLALNTLAGLLEVPRIYYEVAAVYSTSTRRFLMKILFPSALPSIIAGLRLGLGTALVLLVAAEMIAADNGLGALVLHYGELLLTAKLFAGVLVLALWGLIVQWLLGRLERKWTPWRR